MTFFSRARASSLTAGLLLFLLAAQKKKIAQKEKAPPPGRISVRWFGRGGWSFGYNSVLFVLPAADHIVFYAAVVGILANEHKKDLSLFRADHPLLKLPFLFLPSQSHKARLRGGRVHIPRVSFACGEVTFTGKIGLGIKTSV